MADAAVAGYAEALFSVASVEGDLSAVEDELFDFAQAFRSNDELRTTLADDNVPAARRLQVVDDLLDGRASATTSSLVAMVVGAGRAAELPAIVDAFIERSAASRNKAVATVRSAIALTADQRERLAAAIRTSTGKDVEIRVVEDPSVLGGVVTEIGDDIIDGSVRRRLNQLRESFR
ncbi:MAG TPA: ATP synthase F1 subunit delta [Acidimicrobiales bacterium]|jgi:F-type H+-transporting ATPase subunit delta|nr:ATP synthase F1 subunit delta [Actinomycetes bacterium]MDP6105152.1 ATP synthase F1 subunit delta [Acidimicrobiales bacterium]MCP4845674.1 ATP synthase F1 subunit delta [Actinomycetes bacterium]MDP6239485.1 ATP synthase F1 subunit delta [Acidimicrobiales bacterium]MDP7124122.1 ATP synthase F1 subunit delta [Acidimicrobiales bacterium]|tara:strand:+ start:1188 stop:1718 length:531 start_codon:yes stop_codon:yes gene_type:complete